MIWDPDCTEDPCQCPGEVVGTELRPEPAEDHPCYCHDMRMPFRHTLADHDRRG